MYVCIYCTTHIIQYGSWRKIALNVLTQQRVKGF